MIRTILVFTLLTATAASDFGVCGCILCPTDMDCNQAAETCADLDPSATMDVCSPTDQTYECINIACTVGDSDDLTRDCEATCEAFGCTGANAQCIAKKDDDGDDDNSCFHEDTLISYKGTTYTLKQLHEGAEPECSVPHRPKSIGVRVTTSCNKTLRVTDTHLVATSEGFKLAFALKPGDIVFADFEGNNKCMVEEVTKETQVQRYFGLNCLHSEVLADGIRTSTFGDFHTLPSWYMYFVGNVVGAQSASQFGDYVAEWYYGLQK